MRKSRVELIDGLLLDMSPKSPRARERHRVRSPNACSRRSIRAAIEIGVGAPLSLANRSLSRISMVFDAGRRSGRTIPATAALVVEVAVSSRTRDLRVKPRLYAGAGVPVYWVIDVDGGARFSTRSPKATSTVASRSSPSSPRRTRADASRSPTSGSARGSGRRGPSTPVATIALCSIFTPAGPYRVRCDRGRA